VRPALLLRRSSLEAGTGVNPLRDETVWDRLALVAMSGTIWFIALVVLMSLITKGI
jgi:hypothetical protein